MIECYISDVGNNKVQLKFDNLVTDERISVKHLLYYIDENNTVESLRYFMMNTPDVFLWKWKDNDT